MCSAVLLYKLLYLQEGCWHVSICQTFGVLSTSRSQAAEVGGNVGSAHRSTHSFFGIVGLKNVFSYVPSCTVVHSRGLLPGFSLPNIGRAFDTGLYHPLWLYSSVQLYPAMSVIYLDANWWAENCAYYSNINDNCTSKLLLRCCAWQTLTEAEAFMMYS